MTALRMHPLETDSETHNATDPTVVARQTDSRGGDFVAQKTQTTATRSRKQQRAVTKSVLKIIVVSVGVGMLLQFTAQRLLDRLAQGAPVGTTHQWENVITQTATFLAVVVLGGMIGLRADRRAIVPGILLGNLVAHSISIACLLFPILAAHRTLPPLFIWQPVIFWMFLGTITEIGIAQYVSRRKNRAQEHVQ